MLTTMLIVVFMFAAYELYAQKTDVRYRCLRCGTSRQDLHSSWCEDKDKA